MRSRDQRQLSVGYNPAVNAVLETTVRDQLFAGRGRSPDRGCCDDQGGEESKGKGAEQAGCPLLDYSPGILARCEASVKAFEGRIAERC